MTRRTVRFSKTFNDQFVELLDWGARHFGERVAENKQQRVYATIEGLLATFPAIKQQHPELGLVIYPITGTPFVVLYDYDEHELRVHFIMHGQADLADLDPSSAIW
jgi:plasmid stabilization system protein ParE